MINLGGIALISCMLFGFLMPYIEQDRSEARLAHTYFQVRKLNEQLSDQGREEEVAMPTDPWGEPLQVIEAKGRPLRVLSTGPNKVTSANGPDEDDVYSDMPESPLAPYDVKRRDQLILATTTSLVVWVGGSLLYLKLVVRKRSPR